MQIVVLYAICLLVGFLVGGTGMGGILIPPSLVLLSELSTHAAMGTTLASFIPMNVCGTLLFSRMGHLPWAKAWPLLIGGACSAGPCALGNVRFNGSFLMLLLSLLILFAGFSAFRPPKDQKLSSSNFWQSSFGLFIIGLLTGTVAGLTGAGGPLLAIAMMVATSTHPLTAVGLSMPYSLSTAVAASYANYLNGNLDFPMLWKISLLEFVAFLFGVRLVSKMPLATIRRLMGITCAGLGLFLFLKTVFA